MVETRIYCDRCHKLIPGGRVSLKPTLGKLKGREPFDLCPSCSDELLDWFGPICGPAADREAPPPPEPEHRSKGRKPPGARSSPPSP
jgi:hypothetical protein